MFSKLRSLRAAIVTGALVAAVVPVIAAAPAAQALSPGVAFSAEAASTWQTNGVVWALGASRGKVIAGGTFTQLRPPSGSNAAPVPVSGLAILDGESGAPDQCQLPVSFADGSTATVRAITTSADGRTAYVAGNFGIIAGVSTGRIAAIDVDSCSVKALRVGGVSSIVNALAVSGNTLYLAGAFTTVSGLDRQRFAAVDATTGDVLPFRADATETGRAVAVSPDGAKVAIGGDFFNVNGTPSHSIAVVDAVTGNNLRTYGSNFIDSRSVTKGIFSGQNRFYVGNEGTGGGVFDGRLAIDWGTLDQVWRDTCLGATQATLEYQGVLYSASHAHNCSSDNAQNGFQDGRRNFFNAQDAATAALKGWDPRANDGINEGIGPRALVTVVGRTTGKTYLWSGGEFTLINGVAQQGLTRFGPDDLNPPPSAAPVAEATGEGTIQLRWRSVVDSDDSELTYRVYRNGAQSPIWESGSSSVWWRRPQLSFVDTAVVPGTTYSYRVSVSDGTNTTPLSAAVTATAAVSAGNYGSSVRADRPSMYFNSTRTSRDPLWLQDVGATSSDPSRTNGLISGYPASSADSPLGAQDTSGSITFDGVDDLGWSDAYTPGPTTYTIETWVKTTTTLGGLLVGYGNGRPRTDTQRFVASPSGKFDRLLYLENSGRVRFGAGSARQAIRSAAPVNDGEWHHLVATQGPSQLVLYIDGLRAARTDATTSNAPLAYRGGWHLAAENLSGWPDRPSNTFFVGQLDETAIYPSALSRTAAAAHFTASGRTPAVRPRPNDAYGASVYDADPDFYWRLGESAGTTAADSSYNGSTPGVYGSAVSKSQAGIPAQAAAPSGDSAVATPGTTSGTISTSSSGSAPQNFSAEVWFKTTTTAGGKLIGFENSQTGASTTYDKHLYMRGNGTLTFGSYGTQPYVINSTRAYNDGSWHHAVAGIGAGGQFLYVDGALVASSTVTVSQAGEGFWRLGGGNLNAWPGRPSNDYFSGSLDEAAIYTTALPRRTVVQHYALGIGDRQAPTVPNNLVATTSGSAVTLTWGASSDDVALDGYLIYRGKTEGFVVGDGSLVGESTSTSFTETPPLTGTYFYRVVARDAAGNSSNPSAAATVSASVPDTVAPSVPVDLVASVEGAAATVSWSASVDEVGVAGYRLFRGTSPDFITVAGNQVTEQDGRSYVDRNLSLGTYFYKVRAFDGAGNVSAASEAIEATVAASTNVVPPSADSRVVRSAPNANYGNNTQLAATGGDRDVIESLLRFQLPSAPPGTNLAGVRIGLRTSGDPTAGSADDFDLVVTDDTWSEADVTWNSRPLRGAPLLATVSRATAVNTPYSLVGDPAALVGSLGSAVSLRLIGRTTGSDNLRLWSREAAAAYVPTLTLTFAPSGDVSPPTTPTASASAAGGDVTVTWTASSDDTAVTGYSVYRGATAGFSVDSASRIADVTGTTYVDPRRPAGTSFYRVVARDAAGNRSPASTAVSASVIDTQAPTQPTSLDAQASGTSQVAVSWTASTDDVSVTDYLLYRGTTAGFGLGAGSLVATASGTSYLDTPPASGTYYYRVVARDAAGNASDPSGEAVVRLGGGDTVSPTIPGDLAASVAGTAVTLTWSASTDNVAVTSYRLYRGTGAGFTPSAANLVVDQATRSYVDQQRPLGASYYKVVAVDEAGNLSAPSGSVTAEVTAITRIVGPVNDSRVHTIQVDTNYGKDTQLAATGGASPVWSLLKFDLPAAPEGTTLAGVEVGLRTSGDPTAGSVDDFGLVTTGNDWTETGVTWRTRPQLSGQKIAVLSGPTAVNTAYRLQGDPTALAGSLGSTISVRISGPEADSGNDNLRLWSREASPTYRPTLTLTFAPQGDVTAPSAPVVAANVDRSAVSLSWQPSTDDVAVVRYSVYRGATPDFTSSSASKIADLNAVRYVDTARPAGTSYYRVIAFDAAGNASGAVTATAATVADVQAPTQPSSLDAQVSGTSRVNVTWTASTDDVAVIDYLVYRGTTADFEVGVSSLVGAASGTSYLDTPPSSGTFYYRVVARDAAGNLSVPSGRAAVLLGGSDTVAPTVPGNLTISVSGGSVTATWSDSIDNVGVEGYRVYRGANADFVADGGSLLAQQAGSPFVDRDRPVGTYFYQVRAVDAAGNVSAPTTAKRADVVATTVDVTAQEDARVVKAAPTTNYGTDRQLAATGGGSVIESFLRFDLPQAPPDQTLTGVTLTVRTSGDPSAGSVDPYAVRVVAQPWTESTLTWNNRPTDAGVKLADLVGLTEVNTASTVTGAASALPDLLSRSVALRIDGPPSSVDNLRLWSREGPVLYRPTLTLTYS